MEDKNNVDRREKMINCDSCSYVDIAEWKVEDLGAKKATPIYWCKKYNKLCYDIPKCPPESEDKETAKISPIAINYVIGEITSDVARKKKEEEETREEG